jgi:hypothetical protein
LIDEMGYCIVFCAVGVGSAGAGVNKEARSKEKFMSLFLFVRKKSGGYGIA